MTISTTPRAAELFTRFDGASVDLSKIRKSDLSFLRGVQLNDPFHEVIINSVEVTSAEINRENQEIDGTIGLRVGLTLNFKPMRGVALEPEDAVLWVVTDGRDVQIEMETPDGANSLDLELDSMEKLLNRLA